MFKKLVIILVSLTVLCSVYVTSAQTKPTATPSPVAEVCEGAQAWYDAIDGTLVANSFTATLDTKKKPSERFSSVEDIRTIADDLAKGEVPDCVALARDWYVDGLNKLADGVEAYIDDDSQVGDLAVALAASVLKIGQFRGYLIAQGVVVADLGTKSFILF